VVGSTAIGENMMQVNENDKVLALLSYIVPLVGIILFIVKKNENKALAFHGLQSFVLGAVLTVVATIASIILAIIGAVLAFTVIVPIITLLVSLVLWPLVLLVMLYGAYSVYTKGDFEVPMLSQALVQFV